MKQDDIKQAAALMGRKGGKSTSEAKSAAARANGKRGGRPPKSSERRWTHHGTMTGACPECSTTGEFEIERSGMFRRYTCKACGVRLLKRLKEA